MLAVPGESSGFPALDWSGPPAYPMESCVRLLQEDDSMDLYEAIKTRKTRREVQPIPSADSSDFKNAQQKGPSDGRVARR